MNVDRFSPGALDPAVPITQQIYVRLRDAIIHSAFSPGDKISESEIARICDVSRQPVREAFIRLAGEGLLDIRPQRGTTITPIVYASVLDACFLREAVEADIVSILAADRDPEVLRELRAQVTAQQSIGAGDTSDFLHLDDRFHRTMAEAAGKTGAWHMIDGQRAQLDRVRFLSVRRSPVEKLVAQHDTIVERIAAGDTAGANTAVRRHLRELLTDLPEIQAANPEAFDLPGGAIPAPRHAPLPSAT
ncbi:MAG: GntR family transcriptional regulator [Rhodobacteraceae bacterium]|nr:MAG: GntR family transcriptional regulator [Paracoccaceae bacterium]